MKQVEDEEGERGAGRQRAVYPWLFDFLPALCMDCAFYLSLFNIQHLLERDGTAPELLATTVAVYSAGYVLACFVLPLLLGPRQRLSILCGAGLALVCMASYGEAGALWEYQVLLGLFALAAALFWPPFQAFIGRDSRAVELPRRLAIFNLGWTVGKCIGFFSAGFLYENLAEPRHIFLIAGALVVILGLLFALRFLLFSTDHEAAPAPSTGAPTPLVKQPSRLFAGALVANFLVWGSQSAIVALIPVIGQTLGFAPWARGVLMAAMVLCQTGTFIVLKRWRGWLHDWKPLAGTCLLCALALLLLPFGTHLALAAVILAVFGVAIGFSYSASIYYAVTGASSSLRTGIHEGTLGLGSLVLPIAFGALVSRLDLATACWIFAGGATAVGLVLALALRRGR